MTGDDDLEMRLLAQADHDGELISADAARVAAWTAGRGDGTQAQVAALSERLQGAARYPAPDALRAAVAARIAAAIPRRRRVFRISQAAAFGGGFALAACLALAFVTPRGESLPDIVVEGHIRALQPGHLMDVASTDQHTVKPWFDGRLDFAPPVKDLAPAGFPLAGGRLDYLAGRPAAALVYQHRQHAIDLFVWPDDGRVAGGPASGSRNGYNFQRWTRDGMAFWAVSDLGAAELADFVRLWQTQ